jgi:hypothetical protein
MYSKLIRPAIAGLLLAASLSAHAQAPEAPSQPGFDAAPSEPVGREMVNKFAAAYGSVQSIQEDYTNQLQEAETREQAQQLQQEAQQEVLAAVQNHGLSVQEYNEMIGRMDQDPELRQQVFGKVLDQ